VQDRQYGVGNFPGAHGFHTTKIDWAFAQEAWTALDVMPEDNVTVSERPG
jgi:hypothetical protein